MPMTKQDRYNKNTGLTALRVALEGPHPRNTQWETKPLL